MNKKVELKTIQVCLKAVEQEKCSHVYFIWLLVTLNLKNKGNTSSLPCLTIVRTILLSAAHQLISVCIHFIIVVLNWLYYTYL